MDFRPHYSSTHFTARKPGCNRRRKWARKDEVYDGGEIMADALKAFEEELQSKNFKGYWQNVQGDVYREPVPSFEPCFWKGKDLFAAMEKAGDVVGLDVSFRRVIQMWNPSLKNGTSRTLV